MCSSEHIEIMHHNNASRLATPSSLRFLHDRVTAAVFFFFSDGISVTGLPISSPLRQLLKPRSETRAFGSESGRAEYSHVKVSDRRPAECTKPRCSRCTPLFSIVFFKNLLRLVAWGLFIFMLVQCRCTYSADNE